MLVAKVKDDTCILGMPLGHYVLYDRERGEGRGMESPFVLVYIWSINRVTERLSSNSQCRVTYLNCNSIYEPVSKGKRNVKYKCVVKRAKVALSCIDVEIMINNVTSHTIGNFMCIIFNKMCGEKVKYRNPWQRTGIQLVSSRGVEVRYTLCLYRLDVAFKLIKASFIKKEKDPPNIMGSVLETYS